MSTMRIRRMTPAIPDICELHMRKYVIEQKKLDYDGILYRTIESDKDCFVLEYGLEC